MNILYGIIFFMYSFNSNEVHQFHIVNATSCDYTLNIYDVYIRKEFYTIIPPKDDMYIFFSCKHEKHYMILETVDRCIPDCLDVIHQNVDVDETNVYRLEGESGDIYQRIVISNNEFSLIGPKCIRL